MALKVAFAIKVAGMAAAASPPVSAAATVVGGAS
jgi:hypothetical protein